MMLRNVIAPTFEGKRFENNSLPLEFMTDLKALQEILYEVAKWIFLRDNPKRKRVSFQKEFQLDLVSIGKGSAVPKLGVFYKHEELELENLFDRSVETFLGLIESHGKENEPTLPGNLPAQVLKLFEPFGRSLQATESCSFTRGTTKVQYTSRVRSRILARIVPDTRSKGTVRGKVSGVDFDAETFFFRAGADKVIGALEDSSYNRIVGLIGTTPRPTVEIAGIFTRTFDGKVTKVDHVERITVVDTSKMAERFAQLVKVDPSWLATQVRSRESVLSNFLNFWEHNVLLESPRPYMYPLGTSAIELEWSLGGRSLVVDVDLANLTGEATEFDGTDADPDEFKIDLRRSETWKRINGFLSAANRSAAG